MRTRKEPASAGSALTLILLAVQALLAARVLVRLVRSGRHRPLAVSPAGDTHGRTVTVLVPVLDEERRLAPCLDGLIAQGNEVREILVVDGGSRDGTVALAGRYAERDSRVRVVDASPVPADWNGKAWNLERVLAEATAGDWVLTIDADVRPRAGLVAALLAEATGSGLDVLSGATRQRLSGGAEGLLHPSLLTSLVYRYGIPGGVTSDPAEVQANGQCMLFRREALEAAGGFTSGQHSLCEDVTVARRVASQGGRVGFMETGDLVDVSMYGGAAEAWRNWPRSLTMRDQYRPGAVAVRLAEVLLVQALPAAVTVAGLVARRDRSRHPALPGLSSNARPAPGRGVALLLGVNRALLITRLGVLAGMRRAYVDAPWTYWLSPLLDIPVALRLIESAIRRRHSWRGRPIERR
jgi:dolichol-phosphate mannosyltransferase